MHPMAKKERKKENPNNGDISEFRIPFSSLCLWKGNLWSGAHAGQGVLELCREALGLKGSIRPQPRVASARGWVK